jgi:hypothetical protein
MWRLMLGVWIIKWRRGLRRVFGRLSNVDRPKDFQPMLSMDLVGIV